MSINYWFFQFFLTAVLQYHRQQELLSSLLKQQHSSQNVSQSTLLQRRQRPSTKEIPLQQTLGLPTLGISPRQSPLPSDVNSAISSQGRIPSPLGLLIILFKYLCYFIFFIYDSLFEKSAHGWNMNFLIIIKWLSLTMTIIDHMIFEKRVDQFFFPICFWIKLHKVNYLETLHKHIFER